jgi:two-component system, NarL family, nitrate/nitrite response regulator NarL
VSLRCLIVDDNPRFLEAARALLERDGLHVVVASSSAEAFEHVQRFQLDVVLVDIDLGGESGFELTKGLPGVRVILISTHAEADFEELIAASPAAGFIPKEALSAGAISATLDR